MSQNYVPFPHKSGTQPGNNLIGAIGGVGGGQVLHVKQVSNANDEDLQTGRTKAPIQTSEQPQSIDIIISSNDRRDAEQSLDPFDFRFSFNSSIIRAKSVQATKVLIPRPPNITFHNDIFRIVTDADVIFNVPIPRGFYTPNQFASELSILLTAGASGNYTCVFDAITQTFTLSCDQPFFVSTNGSFYIGGRNFVRFVAFDETIAGNTVALVGNTLFKSSFAGMLYARYMYVCSEFLNEYAFAITATSDPTFNEDVIASVSLTSVYTKSDWDESIPYNGLYRTVDLSTAPHIAVRNPQRGLKAQGDVYCVDEYGDNFNLIYDLGPLYPRNNSGVVVFLTLRF